MKLVDSDSLSKDLSKTPLGGLLQVIRDIVDCSDDDRERLYGTEWRTLVKVALGRIEEQLLLEPLC